MFQFEENIFVWLYATVGFKAFRPHSVSKEVFVSRKNKKEVFVCRNFDVADSLSYSRSIDRSLIIQGEEHRQAAFEQNSCDEEKSGVPHGAMQPRSVHGWFRSWSLAPSLRLRWRDGVRR